LKPIICQFDTKPNTFESDLEKPKPI